MEKEKAKAIEIMALFRPYAHDININNEIDLRLAKASTKHIAIIHVKGIIEALSDDLIIYGSEYRYEATEFWQGVLKEIEKL